MMYKSDERTDTIITLNINSLVPPTGKLSHTIIIRIETAIVTMKYNPFFSKKTLFPFIK